MNWSLRALRYFVAAAEAGSITAAAGQVHVSQPAISEAIGALERDLGVQLMIRRQGKGLTLTPSGDRLLVQARNLLAHADEVARFAAGMGSRLSGEIRIGCFVTLAPFVMPGLIAAFRSEHPEVDLQFEEANQSTLLDRLRAGRIDVALSYAYGLSEEFAADVLAELPPRVVVAGDHPRAAAGSVSLRAFAAEPMIIIDLPHTRDYFLSLFRSLRIEPDVVWRVQSYEMARAMAARGLGFSILNAIPREARGYDGRKVVALAIDEALPQTLVVSLRSRRVIERPSVTVFSEFVQRWFAGEWRRVMGPAESTEAAPASVRGLRRATLSPRRRGARP
jgi:DNA-binding transcriptional LysR family regulator